MTSEDVDLVDSDWLVVDTVGLDDGHVVAVDLERVVRIAGQVDKAEAVALALGHGDDGELSVRAGRVGGAAQAVDKGGIRSPARRWMRARKIR